ncbi:MAG: hypothetical protein GWP91_05365, partial [Rhodobacterales bacterium]|nr:hypothetical protein [Rhodobacterales bacterium]
GEVRVEVDPFEPTTLSGTELAVFSKVPGEIRLTAKQPTWLVYGAAIAHPHELALGRYSVHTNIASLEIGEQRIRQLHAELSPRFAST